MDYSNVQSQSYEVNSSSPISMSYGSNITNSAANTRYIPPANNISYSGGSKSSCCGRKCVGCTRWKKN